MSHSADIASGLHAVERLAEGRMPALALDLMLGTRLTARGYANQSLKAHASRLANAFAAEWRRSTPAKLDSSTSLAGVRERMAELAEAERLGQPHPALAHALRRWAAAHPAAALLGFDALHGPPPDGHSATGWRLYATALVRCYAAQRAGVLLVPAVNVGDVLRWLPAMRAHYVNVPIGAPRGSAARAGAGDTLAELLRLGEQCYAVTHVLLVLRDFFAMRPSRP